MHLNHLDHLESESIYILREIVAECANPAMLYSMGKDSSVMFHLALKAFYPAKLPFPLLHVDTTWKFRAMLEFRERIAKQHKLKLITYSNLAGLSEGINPFDFDASTYTDVMKTAALKQAIEMHQFDAVFAGARRDEEKSRAKERIVSRRNRHHRWDPKNQRPELWNLYNTYQHKGECLRVFPMSNWTEIDIWRYIQREKIEVVPLYFAAFRPVVERKDSLIMVDDWRMRLMPLEKAQMRFVRFRTLGCYPLTGAIESKAVTIPAIIEEIRSNALSERQGRLIDGDRVCSMEMKKQEGYF